MCKKLKEESAGHRTSLCFLLRTFQRKIFTWFSGWVRDSLSIPPGSLAAGHDVERKQKIERADRRSAAGLTELQVSVWKTKSCKL